MKNIHKIIITKEEPKKCEHDIIMKYGVVECQNCGMEHSEILAEKPKQIILKDPNTCDYYKKVGCTKDICDCYTMITKQETLEEASEEYAYNHFDMHEINHFKALKQGFEAGAKYIQKQMFSEEEVKHIIEKTLIEYSDYVLADVPEWFENFKKK